MTDRTEKEGRDLAQDISERANRLYWNSDRSVNSIADGLGLSKGGFYGVIRPIESGRHCSSCQLKTVFANRTAQERDDAFCPVCDASGLPAPSVPSAAQRFSAPANAPSSSSTDDSRLSEISGNTEPSPLLSEPKGVLASFFVGTVVGILLGRFLRH